jgi:hypothetical protein
MTLIEVAIALTLTATIVMAVAISAQSASRSYQGEGLRSTVDTQAHRALDFVTRELAEAERATLNPFPDPALASDSLTYRKSLGFADGAALWGPWMQLSTQLEAGEIDDGLDNNRNGLADERVLVWTERLGQADQRQTIRVHAIAELAEGELANGMDDDGDGLDDEPGLVFSIDRDVLTVQLTLARRDAQGRTVTKSVLTAVRVRN